LLFINVQAHIRKHSAALFCTLFVLLSYTLPPVFLLFGDKPNHEVKCLLSFHLSVLVPVSEINFSKLNIFIPGISHKSTPNI